ncbi:MAG: hypothetical protein WC426_01730 [Sulfuriferula sp.]
MESDNNSKYELAEALRKAAVGNARSKVARLREVFDEVEAARTAGVSHKKIVEALASRGLEFDLGTFEITRYRIAKEREKKNGELAQTSLPTHKTDSNSIKIITEDSVTNAEKSVIEPVDELIKPAGISNAAWSEMRIKAAAEKRKKLLS